MAAEDRCPYSCTEDAALPSRAWTQLHPCQGLKLCRKLPFLQVTAPWAGRGQCTLQGCLSGLPLPLLCGDLSPTPPHTPGLSCSWIKPGSHLSSSHYQVTECLEPVSSPSSWGFTSWGFHDVGLCGGDSHHQHRVSGAPQVLFCGWEAPLPCSLPSGTSSWTWLLYSQEEIL